MESTAQLHVHEWVAILIIANVLIILALVTRFSHPDSNPSTLDPHYIVEQKIEIFVEGALEGEQPLRLVVMKGTKVEDILSKIQLLPDADISKLKLQSKVRSGQHIRIPHKKKRQRKVKNPKTD